MGMGIDDGLNWFGGYLLEFNQDLGGFFHGGHGVHDNHTVIPLNHDGIGDAVSDGRVDIVSDLFHALFEYPAVSREVLVGANRQEGKEISSGLVRNKTISRPVPRSK